MPGLSLLILGVVSAVFSCSWGPGHHLEFAERVYRRRKDLLPSSLARLLQQEHSSYTYGNLAADVINIKSFGGHHNHCHRWTIVDEMRDRSGGTAAEEAFVLGYLSHLAADTIAHNHFVPYHLVRFARGRGLGHLYWEMMADRFVPETRWQRVNHLQAMRELDSLDDLINATVPRKALPMGANKAIFNHVLLVSKRRTWRQGVDRLHPIGRVMLKPGFLQKFQRAATDRVRLALRPRGIERLEHVDTTGKKAQQEAMRLRKRLVREHPPGTVREELGSEWAKRFLTGMESPPKRSNTEQPHW